jgi:hypothetical protein
LSSVESSPNNTSCITQVMNKLNRTKFWKEKK